MTTLAQDKIGNCCLLTLETIVFKQYKCSVKMWKITISHFYGTMLVPAHTMKQCKVIPAME